LIVKNFGNFFSKYFPGDLTVSISPLNSTHRSGINFMTVTKRCWSDFQYCSQWL